MKKVIIIYDVPWGKCDKKWLYEKSVERGLKTIRISPRKTLYDIEIKNKIFYLYVMCICFFMSLKAVLIARPGDVIVGWKTISGMFASILSSKKVQVISLNWLTPQPNDKLRFLKNITINKENTWIGVNCENTKKQLVEEYKLQNSDRIFWIPDIPAEDYAFEELIEKNERYCFTGGINNRDWNLILNVAKKNRDIEFQCVAVEKYYKENVNNLVNLNNLKLHFDLERSKYYSILKNAYIMVLPLKDNRVAGLINVIKSIELGILPLTSKNEAIEQYYPQNLRTILQFEVGNVDELSEKIHLLYSLSYDEYKKYLEELREYLRMNFNADVAISCIINKMESN